MVRLKPADWPTARSAFLAGAAALAAFAAQMRLDGFDPDDPGVQALRWK